MDLRLKTSALVQSNYKLADVFHTSVARSKCGEGEKKIQFSVIAPVNFVRWLIILFLIGDFVIFVSQICLLNFCMEIICVLRRLNVKILFILNRDQKILGHTPRGPFLLSLMGIVEKTCKQLEVLTSK